MPLPDTIDAARIMQAGVVSKVDYFDTIGSTQDYALEQARGDCPALPLVVVAEEQTAGRGRGQNRWWTGRGSLAMSLVVDPADWGLAVDVLPVRSLAVGVAIVETLRPHLRERYVGLHWPNDVFVAERKIAGVLVDVLSGGRHIIGIGLNVNNSLAAAPDDVRSRATSLCELADCHFDRTELLIELLARLRAAFIELGADPEAFGLRFNAFCSQIGQRLTIDVAGRRTNGSCAGIAADGALLLETSAGFQKIYSGVLVHAPDSDGGRP